MSLEPLLEAPWVIQVHAFAAVAAFFLGIVQFAAPKGTATRTTVTPAPQRIHPHNHVAIGWQSRINHTDIA